MKNRDIHRDHEHDTQIWLSLKTILFGVWRLQRLAHRLAFFFFFFFSELKKERQIQSMLICLKKKKSYLEYRFLTCPNLRDARNP